MSENTINEEPKQDSTETGQNNTDNEEKVQYEAAPEFQGIAKNVKPLTRNAPLISDLEYIEQRLLPQRDYFDRKSSFNQKKYKLTKRWEFILAASIPVVISLSTMGAVENTAIITHTVLIDGKAVPQPFLSLSSVFQICAAAAGVILVILNKMLELEEYYKNWKEYRLTNEQLEQERLLYLTRTEPYDEENAFPMFVERVEGLLAKQVQRWRQVPKQQNDLLQKALDSLDKQSRKLEDGTKV